MRQWFLRDSREGVGLNELQTQIKEIVQVCLYHLEVEKLYFGYQHTTEAHTDSEYDKMWEMNVFHHWKQGKFLKVKLSQDDKWFNWKDNNF